MAATVWIVRANQHPNTLVNGIDTVIINKDDTTVNAAQAIDAAEAALVAAGYEVPSNYFDSAAQWNATGQIDADDDALFFANRVEAIAP